MSAFKILGHDTASSIQVIDPVCGMTVEPVSAKAKVEHRGSTYYFCCTGCASKFQADPGKYVAARPDRNLFPVAQGVNCNSDAGNHAIRQRSGVRNDG